MYTPMRQGTRQNLISYGLALASVTVATAAFILLRSRTPLFKTHGFFFILLIAVILSAWKGGIGPASLATACSVLVGSWSSFRQNTPSPLPAVKMLCA